VLHGAHRVREVADRLLAMLAIAIPRVQRMVDDKALDRRKADLKTTLDRMLFARDDLPATRARATNDSDRAHPDGLRFIDLKMLMIHAETTVAGSEIATKRNLTGIDYAMNLAFTSPDQRYATDWVERTLGAPLQVLGSGILLFVPQEYGRVVVVHGDGRLAYDPGAPLEDDD
jgi:hypothetical protein